MDNSIKNTLLAHVRLVKQSYGEITNGVYELEFGALGTYRIEFMFIVINDNEQAELKLYKNNEILFWVMHEHTEALLNLRDYIDSL